MNNQGKTIGPLVGNRVKMRRRLGELKRPESQHESVEELIKSEECYRRLVELCPDMIALHSQGKCVYINPAGAKMLGASRPEELIGRSVFEIIHPEYIEIAKERLQRLEKGREVPIIEEKFIRRDGTSVDVEMTAAPILFQGEPMVQVVARDITERKRAEEALREPVKRYRTLLETMDEGYFEVDLKGNYTFVNDSLCKVHGASRDELIGLNNREFMDKETARRVFKIFNQVYNTGQPVKLYEWEVIKKDGKRAIEESSVYLIRNAQGEPVGFRGITRDITERKQTEELYRTLTDSSQVGIYIIQDGKFRFMNPRFRAYFQDGSDGTMDIDPRSIIHPEDREKVRENAINILKNGLSSSHEFRIIDGNGKIRWLLERVTSISYEGKRAVLANAIDITDLKKVADTLRWSEETAQRLAEENAIMAAIGRIISSTLRTEEVYDRFAEEVSKLIPLDRISIHLFNPEAGIATVVYASGAEVENLRAEDSFPFGPLSRELMRTRKSLLIQTDNPDEVARYSLQPLTTFLTGLPSMMSVPLIFNDQVIGVLYIRSAQRNAYTENDVKLAERVGNQIAGAIANARLFAERQQAEKALRESEEKYRFLVQNANDAIFIAQDDVIKFPNIKAEELLGYSAAELAKTPFIHHIHPDDRDLVLGRHRDRLDRKAAPDIYSFRLRNKSGDDVWVELNSVFILWEERPATLNFLRNITEQKTLETQFLQAQKMEAVGRLAGGIAHDFNNLLTIINTHAQLGLTELKEWDPLRGKLESIQKAGERAANLTRQLLAFSRRQTVEMKVIDINTLLQDLKKMLHRVMGEDIELLSVLDKDLGRVRVDPGQIEQAILNLVINARDAMPSGGKLTLETTNVERSEEYAYTHLNMKPGRYVMLSVSDTGVGMTPEIRDQIFEPFFTTKDKGKGTGLGLSTVYGIVKQSEGSIWVYSEPGKGTTFKIYLPRVDEPLEEAKKKVLKGECAGGSETILVVEDEEEVRKLAVQILSKHGYKVLEASHGGDALLICEQWKKEIHLLLTDVVMPKINGPDLARRLKFFHPGMKVLFMSGYTDAAILQNGVLDRKMPFLQKPFSMEGLAGMVREVLDQ
jgi:PAS domain S-box-containing protein